jgi:undecaprenyl-diphosphatase
MSWNEDLFRFINEDMANPGLDVFFSVLIILGTVYVWLVLVPALWWKGKRNEAADLFFLILLVVVVTTLLKFLFASPRPEDIREVPLPVPGYFGFDVYSFPSNHASRAFACAVFLSFRFKKWTVPLFVYAFLIGLAKIYVGAHYPGDIIAGAAIGIALGLSVSWLTRIESYTTRREDLVTWIERLPDRTLMSSRGPPPWELENGGVTPITLSAESEETDPVKLELRELYEKLASRGFPSRYDDDAEDFFPDLVLYDDHIAGLIHSMSRKGPNPEDLELLVPDPRIRSELDQLIEKHGEREDLVALRDYVDWLEDILNSAIDVIGKGRSQSVGE